MITTTTATVGVPTFNMDGITVRHNFTGCLENVVYEGSKMITDAKNRIPGYTVGNSQIQTNLVRALN
jgi:hypothetical protein